MPQPKEQQKELKKKRNKELVAYFGQLVGKEGLGATLGRTWRYVKRRYGSKKGRFLPKKATLAAQRTANTTGWPVVSICVPVYNVNPHFWQQLLQSVLAQSYAGWQLCIADASDDGTAVRQSVKALADPRIAYTKVENLGIAQNTNAAAKLATGSYIALLDHDDLLAPNAMFEVAQAAFTTKAGFIYSDEALFVKDMQHPVVGHFKPDYSPQYLLNCNYIAHLTAIETGLFNKVGGLHPAFNGSQDHDLYLRVLEETSNAVHIAKVLYYWRQHAGSTSTGTEAKPYVRQAALDAITQHLQRIGQPGTVVDGKFASTYKVNYKIQGQPLVSIIIPSFEHVEDLRTCLTSIYQKTTYPNFEVVVVENNSKKEETFAYYKQAQAEYPNCRVVTYVPPAGFNFSAICNFGRAQAKGQYLLFLNNDVEVITPDWIEQMLQLCQLPGVGITGAMLYYPDDTVQHAGVIVGLGGYAGHSHKYAVRGRSGYMFRQACVQELSAVTGACLMAKATLFDEIDGFDEAFTVAYNDVDFCLRARATGLSVVFTPYAELYHHESKSRGSDEGGEALQRFKTEQQRMRQRYGQSLMQDPYYNANLTYDREDFTESDSITVT
ncbi:glycosyltransferase family 2 protein [Ruminococcaceae bacterium OttesenSCG-928-A16]|nr:glycosyltransferase family 2 protein [Ruminococcaceae bacterium OttesenSCG-928-A16]